MKKVCSDCKCFTIKEEQAYCNKHEFFLLLNCGCYEIEPKMDKIIEYVKDYIMYNGKNVKDLTELINSINFERFNVEKSEENIQRIEKQVIKELNIELDRLDEFLNRCHFDNPNLFQILENQRKNIKKVL